MRGALVSFRILLTIMSDFVTEPVIKFCDKYVLPVGADYTGRVEIKKDDSDYCIHMVNFLLINIVKIQTLIRW